ncbi:MAG: hypothetical protein N4A49_13695 [Marinifilaceae bacterium]|jgi:hypothetical protein|nr:hypothetical protein [Marinifilaceae bacterium]
MKRFLVLLILCCIYNINDASAQCNEYTKKVWVPLLSPYTHNQQLNTTVLSEGESADLHTSFSKDQEYRILVKGEDNLGKLEFQLLDTEYNILYTNKQDKYKSHWDFMVENSDNFIIRVIVKGDDNKDTVESGCVAILIGFRAFGSSTTKKTKK